jgi:predicted transposase/invertase (TIGR01784 family)
MEAKSSRLDVHVTFNDGEVADLEMQVEPSDDDLKTRAEVYVSMLLAAQSKKGKHYNVIKKVYQIFFLNCVLFPQSGKIPRRYSYREEEEHDRLNDLTEVIFYEMPKLEQKVQDYLEGKIRVEDLSEEEKWCMYMKYRHEEHAGKLIKDLCREEGIMRAEKTVNGISRDYLKAAREMAIIKNRLDRGQAQVNAQRKAQAEGHAEGLAKGLEKGLEKGLSEGLKKGLSEGMEKGLSEGLEKGMEKEKLEIARKMKDMGDSVERIHMITGLSPEDLERL